MLTQKKMVETKKEVRKEVKREINKKEKEK